MRDNNRVSLDPYPSINEQTCTISKTLAYISCEQAYTWTRSRDACFSWLEWQRENGVILLTLFVIGHDSGPKC